MRTTRILLGTTLFFGIGALAALRAQSPPHAAPAPVQTVAVRQSESPILGYKTWTKVNQKPHPVTSELALMCRTPTQKEIDDEAADPHLEPGDRPSSMMRMRYVTVYVNRPAEQAILHEKRPVFPEGCLIVKERLATPTSTVPELITVMHKREKGYSPKGGDWEYLTLDGTGKQITAQGRLQKCQSCHSEWKKTDYVSRAYLSEDITRKFR